ncbi:MAG: hypothetical protein ACT4O2_12330 [Beijerinckiaceae bacterium]
MFRNLKTKGFNLEDTHLTNAAQLATLFGGDRFGHRAFRYNRHGGGAAAAYPLGRGRCWPSADPCRGNPRRRKSSSSKRFPQPTPVPNSPSTH